MLMYLAVDRRSGEYFLLNLASNFFPAVLALSKQEPRVRGNRVSYGDLIVNYAKSAT